MNATQQRTIPEPLRVVATLAHVLQKLESSQVPVGPDQYLSVVTHLSDELARLPVDEDLRAVLSAYPAASELYENLNYRHAGLCRSPLDASLAAEGWARDILERARRSAGSVPGG